MYLEMTVFGFTMDAIANRPVVILKDARDENTIPIWMSTTEAFAIAAELILWEGSASGRAKDLLALFLEQTGTSIGAIIIEGLNDGVFTTTVKFLRDGEELLVGIRPCEAIMAALKYKMPILVAEEVLERASVLSMSSEELAGENNARRFAEFLDNLDPATLGKYPM
jgi:bifunctional DNase/RNase